MKGSVLIFLQFLFIGVVVSQPNVFNLIKPQVNYSTKVFEVNDTYLICHSPTGNRYGMHYTDTNGNDLYSILYGTSSCILDNANRNSNGEIMLIGHSFQQPDSSLSSYQKGYITITDLVGNKKTSFFLHDSSTLWNRPYNGLYFKGSYYFCGVDYNDSTISPPYERVFVCKTDTLGNLLWYTTNMVQSSSWSQIRMGLGVAETRNSLLFGSYYTDSVLQVWPYTAYYSYLLNELDTNGNFIQRIALPSVNSINPCPCSQSISEIKSLPDKRILVVGTENVFVLDSNLTIIENDTNLYDMIGGYFGYRHLTENSLIIGGFKGFMKLYNGDTVFLRSFEAEPDIISLNDLIPTKDGGYIGIIHNLGTTRVLKLDCEGNYVNPTWCFPVNTSNNILESTVLEIYPNPTTNLLYIKGRQGKRKDLFNTFGQHILTTEKEVINVDFLPTGIYYLKCLGDVKKVLIE